MIVASRATAGRMLMTAVMVMLMTMLVSVSMIVMLMVMPFDIMPGRFLHGPGKRFKGKFGAGTGGLVAGGTYIADAHTDSPCWNQRSVYRHYRVNPSEIFF